MNIEALRFISESRQGMIYEIEYKTGGDWLNRSEEIKTKVFVERESDDKFSPIIKDYFTGECMPNFNHLHNLIMHDYELNAKSVTFKVNGVGLVGVIK